MEKGMAKKASNKKNLLVRNPDVVLREEDPDGASLFNPNTNQIRVIKYHRFAYLEKVFNCN
jgi:hypothetical protein